MCGTKMKLKHYNKQLNEEFRKEVLRESYSDKVAVIQNFLDKNFIRAKYTGEDDNGVLINIPIVIQMDENGQPSKKSLTDQQLFYLLQNKFKTILPKEHGRDKFIIQVLKDWYSQKITKHGTLTKYDF
jgi:hypothetical protein